MRWVKLGAGSEIIFAFTLVSNGSLLILMRFLIRKDQFSHLFFSVYLIYIHHPE